MLSKTILLLLWKMLHTYRIWFSGYRKTWCKKFRILGLKNCVLTDVSPNENYEKRQIVLIKIKTCFRFIEDMLIFVVDIVKKRNRYTHPVHGIVHGNEAQSSVGVRGVWRTLPFALFSPFYRVGLCCVP